MNTLIVDNTSLHKEALADLVGAKGDKTTVVDFRDFNKDKARNHNLVILSGNHYTSYLSNKDLFVGEEDYVRNITIPTIGICFGMRIAVLIHGGVYSRLPQKVQGVRTIEVIQDDPIFGTMSKFRGYVSQTWALTTVPEGFIPLAMSKYGIEVIKHKIWPFYGFQFHPEVFDENNDGRDIFLNAVVHLTKSSSGSN